MSLIPNFDWNDKKQVIPLAISVTLLGVALGVELIPALLGPSAPPPQEEPVAESRAAAPRAAAAPAPRGPGTVPVVAANPLSLDQFMGLLERETPEPVTRRFSVAFMADPVLREKWVEFRAARGAGAPAREFFAELKRAPEFRRLLSQFHADPQFQHAFFRLAAIPAVNDVVRGGSAAGGTAGGAQDGLGRPRLLRGAAAAAGAPPGMGAGSAGTGGAGLLSFAGGGGNAAAGARLTPKDAAGYRTTADGQADNDSPDHSIGDAQDVGRDLGAVQDAKGDADGADNLDSLFSLIPKDVRNRMLKFCMQEVAMGQGCDLEGACVEANAFDYCREACVTSGKCHFGQNGPAPAPNTWNPPSNCDGYCVGRDCSGEPLSLDESCKACLRHPPDQPAPDASCHSTGR